MTNSKMKDVKYFVSLLQKRDEQKMAIQITEDLIAKEKKNFIATLKEICFDGVREYNKCEKTIYRVMTDNFALEVDLVERKISARVDLCDKNGRQPFGDLDLGDPTRIAINLGHYINQLLSANKIPFKFDLIRVPDEYYMK